MKVYKEVLIVSFITVFPAAFLSAQSNPASVPPVQTESEPKITMQTKEREIPLREEVKILRAERRRKMPYLDKKTLKEGLNAKTVKAKRAFGEKQSQTLKDVLVRAAEVYTPARAAQERITLAKRRILVAARELLPEASFNFELRKGSLSGDAFSGSDYHFSLRTPVFRGGILWNTLLRERAELRAAKRDYDGILNELVDQAANAYFEYNRAFEVFREKKDLLQKVKEKHRQSQEKHKQALISEIEYLNSESLVGQIQYDGETAEQELELAKLELQQFLDLETSDPIQIEPLYAIEQLMRKVPEKSASGPLTSFRPLNQSLDDLVDLAYGNRPELQAEAARVRASRLEEAIRKGAFLPRVDVLMEMGEFGEAFIRNADDPAHTPEWRILLELSNNILGNTVKYSFDNDENAPSVSQFLQGSGSQITRRKLELNFLDALEDYAELQEAKVKRLEQVIELEKKERDVIREVKEAYFDYRKAEVQVESSLKRTQYREKLVKLSELRLGKAEIEISEYLQAEIDLAEERGRLHQALGDLSKARSKLNRSIGIRGHLPLEGERYGL